jgi:hypothetical protein
LKAARIVRLGNFRNNAASNQRGDKVVARTCHAAIPRKRQGGSILHP